MAEIILRFTPIYSTVASLRCLLFPICSLYFLGDEISCSEVPQHSRIAFASHQESILNFSATIRHTPQASLIDLRGRLTFFEVGVLRENVSRLLSEGRKHLILNLSGLQ